MSYSISLSDKEWEILEPLMQALHERVRQQVKKSRNGHG
jgi:transposase